MLAWLRTRRLLHRTARSLYGSIMSAARRPVFYANWGVPDTTQGRFEMIALHLALAVRRLGSEGERGKRLAQALMETFVLDMDDAMRELTFSDLAVPREVKRATAAVFDRHKAYLAAIDEPDNMLPETIKAQLAYLGASGLHAGSLANYLRCAGKMLEMQPGAEVLAGKVVWPDPINGQEAHAN
jgi:cytochrome b pre-mRNA-processing protein 3